MAETPGILVSPVAVRGNFQVFYNSVDMGLVDDVDPTKFKMIWEGIYTGSTGKKNKIGDRFVGAEGVVSVQFRQVTLAMQTALCPWSTGTPINMFPPLNADMFTYAQLLQLHPLEMGTNTTQDLLYAYAVPMLPPVVKRTGGVDDVCDMDFAIYPSRTAFQASYGAMNIANIKGT